VLQRSNLEIDDVAALVNVRDFENKARTVFCFDSKVLVTLAA